jgi:hypothetical protein
MDPLGTVVIGNIHGRIEGVHLASVFLHRLVETPLVVDTKRVDDASAQRWSEMGPVQTNGLLSVNRWNAVDGNHDSAKILN